MIHLVITLVTSQANGFSIRRLEPLPPTSDLELGQSSRLEVRYDLETPKSLINRKADGDMITLKESTSTKTTTNSFIDLATGPDKLQNVNEHKHLSEIRSSTLQTVTKDSTVASTLSSMIEPNRIYDSNFTSPTTEVMLNKKTNESESKTTESELKRSPQHSIQMLDSSSLSVNSTEAARPMHSSLTLKYTDKRKNTIENMDNQTYETNTVIGQTYAAVPHDDRPLYSTEILQTTQNPGSKKFNFEKSSQPVGDTFPQPTVNMSVTDLTIKTDASLDMTQSPTASEESFKVTMIDFTTDSNDEYLENNFPTTVVVPILETLNTQTTKEETGTSTLPTSQTYITYDINITSTERIEETTTSSGPNMSKAESAQMSLEKVTKKTQIPSQMELQNDLINDQEYITKIYSNESNVTLQSNLTTPSTQNFSEGLNLQTENYEIISSKRAGYLVNTEIIRTNFEATTEKYVNVNITKDTDTFGAMYETEGSEGEVSDVLEVKNVTGLESQSQLVSESASPSKPFQIIVPSNSRT